MSRPFMKYFPVAAREGVFRRPRALQIEPEDASKEGMGRVEGSAVKEMDYTWR
jgi:hypothetical protein